MEVQKKHGTLVSFDFKEDHFVYQLKDSSGTHTLKIRYLWVDILTIDEFIERNEWYRNVGIFWIAISIFMILGWQRTPIWLFLGICALAYYKYSTINFTSLNTDGGRCLIIKDDIHDSILERIFSEKRKSLRENLFKIDPDNSLESETLKFEYLRDNGAITQEEFVAINTELLKKVGMITDRKCK